MATKKTAAHKNLEWYDKMVAALPEIERKGAAMPYTSLNGHMFSFMSKEGKIGLRLPAEDREVFLKKYKTELFKSYGTVLKEYVTVPGSLLKNTKELKKYFENSYEFVKSLKPKPTTKKLSAAEQGNKQPQLTNRNSKVDEFIKKKKNPLTEEIQRVREIILETSDKIEEDIKWSAPTFIYKGNIASYFMNTKQHVSLMFHTGAAIPDKYQLLEGEGNTSRVARFADMKDIEKKKKALQSLFKEWIKMKDKDS